ncbi:MAG: NADH-quinone oxidoreductase subunit H [Fimbriimonadales bacterium]|nr:NADH-quinone oxidoreductase subunit H [Fimbriimonadales bacterium]
MSTPEIAIRLFAAVLLAPIAGMLLVGLDRRISARLQGRVGPPVTQPFYDLVKLLAKQGDTTSRFQTACLALYLASNVVSLAMVFLGQDLLVMLFVVAFGAVAYIVGGFSAKSPYSQLGTQREMLQLLTYEPLLIFLAVGIYLRTGSFLAADVLRLERPLLPELPVFALTLVVVYCIKLRKSPFDIAASAHHGHQEVVRGPLSEVAGPSLALVELAHWYELPLLLSIAALLWATPLWAGVLLGLACLLASIVVDNVAARLTWSWMLRFGWAVAVPASIANLLYLYATRGGGS